MKMKFRLLAIILVTTTLAKNAEAIVTSYTFSGIDAIIVDPDNFIGGSASNLEFSGSFSIDHSRAVLTSTFPGGPGQTFANYSINPPLTPNHLRILVNGIEFSADNDAELEIAIGNGTPGNPNPTDSFQIFGLPDVPEVGVPIHPSSIINFILSNSGDNANLFPSNDVSIPTIFDLNNFNSLNDNAGFVLQFRDANDVNNVFFQVTGNIESLIAIPEPSIFVLVLLLGLSICSCRVDRMKL